MLVVQIERWAELMLTQARAVMVTPSAARLTGSLRDIGYDFPSAVADIVDNSIAAGARNVLIEIEFEGQDSFVMISDDGRGMSWSGVEEALRYGTRRSYIPGELGRYGLGLKTASLSQCRSLTVVSRSSTTAERRAVRMLDLDLVAKQDDWLVIDPGTDDVVARARRRLAETTGTVVIWRNLDRVLPEKRPEGGWARRRLDTLASRTSEHLGMVFHRFLDGTAGPLLTITINGQKIEPWNPFAPDEPATTELSPCTFELVHGSAVGIVRLRRFVLPSKDRFVAPDGFDHLSGPLKWNRQQGLYIYRANRLVQWGGWGGIRGIDEHTKLARAALDFGTDLDEAFNINVAKIKVSIPGPIRQMLEQPINELCNRADAAYRKTPRQAARPETRDSIRNDRVETGTLPTPRTEWTFPGRPSAGLALRSAAMQAGEYPAFERIVAVLRNHAPDVAEDLGLMG